MYVKLVSLNKSQFPIDAVREDNVQYTGKRYRVVRAGRLGLLFF